MQKNKKDKSPQNIKLPNYLCHSDYEPKPTGEQELDIVWDGELLPVSDDE